MPGKGMTIGIHRSYRMLCYLLFSHGLAISALTLLPLHVAVKLGLAALLLTSLTVCCGRFQWFKSPHAIVQLERSQHGQWRLGYSDGRQGRWLSLCAAYVSPALVIVQLKAVWWPICIVIPTDAVAKDDMRKLSIVLRDIKSFR